MGGSGGSEAGAAALQRTPFVLRGPAPDTGVLAGLEGPGQARLEGGAAPADGLGLVHLGRGRTRRANREEELGILLSAERAVAPVHAVQLLGLPAAWGEQLGVRARPGRPG